MVGLSAETPYVGTAFSVAERHGDAIDQR